MEKNTAPLLEIRNIKKDFFGNQVLEDINFTLEAGEVLGLVGENGAGKSTLMKILFGMDVIRETGGYGGDVLLNGETVRFSTPFDALAAGIGMVHQEFSLIPGFTATENILLAAEGIGLGAVWIGVYPYAPRVEAVSKALKLPEEFIPLNVISIGRPDGKDMPKQKYRESKVHWIPPRQ